jgi:hypothetical protein
MNPIVNIRPMENRSKYVDVLFDFAIELLYRGSVAL